MNDYQELAADDEVDSEHEGLRALYLVVAVELAASIAALYALTRWAA